MEVMLHAVGNAPLVTHNERLADPLDPITRLLATITKKRNKTEADHTEIARIEWFGGLYMTEAITVDDGDVLVPAGSVPSIPAWNMLRTLQEGGKRHKRGADVLRGVHPAVEQVPIEYDGITDPYDMWKSGEYALRKGVGVQRARTIRTRPIFTDWKLSMHCEIDPVVFDFDTVQTLWNEAGRYVGLCEMRPVYGRFVGTVVAINTPIRNVKKGGK